MKEVLLKIFLYTHIATGSLALLSGLVAVINKKGGNIHRKAGKVFFVTMILVATTAFVISVVKSNTFLLAISIFSFYLNYSGYRILKNKQFKFTWYDWVVNILSAVLGIYMVATWSLPLSVFGAVLLYLLFKNIQPQLGSKEELMQLQKEKVLHHINNMMGAYIATVTAFLVVNINFVKPGWVLWLLPTAIGIPIILYYNKIWKQKLKVQ